jgi:Zn-dependent protease
LKKYTKIKSFKVYGARVYLHWSAILVGVVLLALSIKSPVLGVISVSSYFAVILLHEAGHAYLAHRLGYQVYGIYIGFMHGICEYEAPYSLKQEALIAWGGVLAQLIVAIPLIVAAQLFEINQITGIGPIVAFLGYISAMTVLINLAPSRPLDGAVAWKLVPILIRENTKNKPKSKTKKRNLKIIK